MHLLYREKLADLSRPHADSVVFESRHFVLVASVVKPEKDARSLVVEQIVKEPTLFEELERLRSNGVEVALDDERLDACVVAEAAVLDLLRPIKAV